MAVFRLRARPDNSESTGFKLTSSALTGHDGKAYHMEVPPNTKRNQVKYIEVVAGSSSDTQVKGVCRTTEYDKR